MKKDYDYIIAGAGCAGLSLLWHLAEHPELRNKRILLVDRAPKIGNDRTWCFWQTEAALRETPAASAISQTWESAAFLSREFSTNLNFAPFRYQLIRSADFYAEMELLVAKMPHWVRLYGEVKSFQTIDNQAIIKVNDRFYTADFLFNSAIIDLPKQPDYHYLLQHFKGWVIKTPQPFFSTEKARLMDFDIPQGGNCRFMYVLPFSETKALVEYTVFSENVLSQTEYDAALRNYITEKLGITDYALAESPEYGIIPMTNAPFNKNYGERVINIGTAGGMTKPSTGYTFRFIQKDCAKIAAALARNETPHRRKTFNDFKYLLYDTTLLHILRHEKLPAAAIFSTLFRKNPTARVLRFLSNESSLIDDIYIMQSVPTRPFLIAFLKEFYKIAVKSPLPQPHFSADAAAIFTNFIKILKEKIDGVF